VITPVLQLQKGMNQLLPGAVQEDGKLGPNTLARYHALPVPLQRKLLNEIPGVAAVLGGGSWVSQDDISRWANGIEAKDGLPAGYLLTLVRHEAISRVQDGTAQFDAASRHGSFVGLTQMGKSAWIDAMRFDRTGLLAGSSYLQATDALKSLAAGAGFALANEHYARSFGYKGNFTIPILYAMHNQGAGWIRDAMDGAHAMRGSQSEQAIQTIATAAQQVMDA
jgi:hypothetical protein